MKEIESQFYKLMEDYLSNDIVKNTHSRRDIFIAGARTYKKLIESINLPI